jgi:hypothetical protein
MQMQKLFFFIIYIILLVKAKNVTLYEQQIYLKEGWYS